MKTTARLSGMKQVSDYLSANADEGDNVVTIRPSATALFGIDSDDRYEDYLRRRTTPTYPFRFNIQKNESLLNGFFKRLALTEFRLNWTLPNLSSAWGNNVLTLWYSNNPGVSSASTTIIVPDGFYDVNDIALELQNQIRSQTGLTFYVTMNATNDYSISFKPPASYSIFFQSQGSRERELVDLLSVPSRESVVGEPPAGYYSTIIQSGVPNMRAMDYMDIVCSQLSYNQNLKDSTSAKVSRDMIARIYLDDMVSSSAVVNTYNYNNTAYNQSITAQTQTGNEVTFTVSSTANMTAGQNAIVSGITGANDVNWNTGVTIVAVLSATSVLVEYGQAPTGTPTLTTARIDWFGSTGYSAPQTNWDNRINGVTPFVIYRQFPYPKQIRWNEKMPIGNVTFELFDDQGRSIQDLWNETYPTNTGSIYANSFVWNCSLLVSED
jgi:hypothetical protein